MEYWMSNVSKRNAYKLWNLLGDMPLLSVPIQEEVH